MKSFLIRYRIPLTLAPVLALMAVGPGFGLFARALPWLVVAVLVAASALAAAAGEAFDARLFALLGVGWTAARFSFPETAGEIFVLRAASTSAFVLLHFTLLIGPWSRFSRRLLPIVRHRRRLGVTAYLFALGHGVLASRTYFGFSFASEARAGSVFFGLAALWFLTFLAATSWDRAQKEVPRRAWTLIHAAAVLGYLGLIAAFLFVIGRSGIPVLFGAWPLIAATVAFAILSSPAGPVARRLRVVMGWKQVHVLVWIAWALIVFHGWTGVVRFQGIWLRAAYLALAGSVLISHAVGWAKRIRDDRRAVARVRKIGKRLLEGGETWIGVGRVEEFRPGVGERVIMDGRPIAVFRVGDRFLAFSAVCAHQKGPLDKGTIDDSGYLTCPWHGWQYSSADGCGPPGHRGDCVPFYPTKTADGIVFVREAAAPCPGGVKPYHSFD